MEYYKRPLEQISVHKRLFVDSKGQEIERIVNEILETKQLNIEIDTSTFEKKIDRLIYQLYKFTDAEIDIIENKTHK